MCKGEDEGNWDRSEGKKACLGLATRPVEKGEKMSTKASTNKCVSVFNFV